MNNVTYQILMAMPHERQEQSTFASKTQMRLCTLYIHILNKCNAHIHNVHKCNAYIYIPNQCDAYMSRADSVNRCNAHYYTDIIQASSLTEIRPGLLTRGFLMTLVHSSKEKNNVAILSL